MPSDSTFVLDILSDPLKLIEALSWVVTILGVPYVLITKLLPWWKTWRDRRRLRSRLGAELYTPEDILRATTYYIRPNCQQIDPAGGEESRLLAPVQEDLFEAVDRILASPSDYKYTILLADSGMGKTSFVLNYYAYHWRHWRKRRRFDLAVVPLGIPNADELVKKIPNPQNTVLFFDAFDEDTRAIRNHLKRLGELLDLSKEFRQVLITCRTQFFRREEEILRETGRIRVATTSAGQSREYLFYKLYLAPFSDEQVEAYVKRRFSIWRRHQRRAAWKIVEKIPDLIARPMLLSFIKELVDSRKSFQYAFQIYEEMVEGWLKREGGFVKDKEALRRFSESLAVDLYVNRETRHAEKVGHEELEPLAQKFGITGLKDWQLRGRSLLNRDADGNYKFVHRSIMEYLFLKRFVDDNKAVQKTPWTDQMKRFLLEMIRHNWETSHNVPFNLSGADLSDIANLVTKPLFALRSKGKKLDADEVPKMIKEKGFFDSSWNKEGHGIFHLYEIRDIEGNKVVHDFAAGLMWQQSGSQKYMPYVEAENFVRDLNNKRFAGFNDWRLPTLEEAMSLMEPKKHGDLYLDPIFDRTQRWIWTADKYSAGAAWVVDFFNGYCLYDVVDDDDDVHAVRGGQSNI